jgi:hypothetical protein
MKLSKTGKNTMIQFFSSDKYKNGAEVPQMTLEAADAKKKIFWLDIFLRMTILAGVEFPDLS